MKAIRHSLITALAGILTTVVAYATHLRGGEITAKRISETSLTYEFTVTIYCDAVGGIQACNAQNQIEYLCFGDGTTGTPPRIGGSVDIGNGTSRNVYKIVHTFPAPGTYKISATIENRNDGVLNMNNSVNTNFYISTIDPKQSLQVMTDIINDIKKNGFTEKEVKDKKKEYLTNYYMTNEASSYQAGVLGFCEASGNWKIFDEINNRVGLVNTADLNKTFNKYMNNISWTYLGKEDKVKKEDFKQVAGTPAKLPTSKVKTVKKG